MIPMLFGGIRLIKQFLQLRLFSRDFFQQHADHVLLGGQRLYPVQNLLGLRPLRALKKAWASFVRETISSCRWASFCSSRACSRNVCLLLRGTSSAERGMIFCKRLMARSRAPEFSAASSCLIRSRRGCLFLPHFLLEITGFPVLRIPLQDVVVYIFCFGPSCGRRRVPFHSSAVQLSFSPRLRLSSSFLSSSRAFSRATIACARVSFTARASG